MFLSLFYFYFQKPTALNLLPNRYIRISGPYRITVFRKSAATTKEPLLPLAATTIDSITTESTTVDLTTITETTTATATTTTTSTTTTTATTTTTPTTTTTTTTTERPFDVLILGNKTSPFHDRRQRRFLSDTSQLLCDFSAEFPCRWGPESGRWGIIQEGNS